MQSCLQHYPWICDLWHCVWLPDINPACPDLLLLSPCTHLSLHLDHACLLLLFLTCSSSTDSDLNLNFTSADITLPYLPNSCWPGTPDFAPVMNNHQPAVFQLVLHKLFTPSYATPWAVEATVESSVYHLSVNYAVVILCCSVPACHSLRKAYIELEAWETVCVKSPMLGETCLETN